MKKSNVRVESVLLMSFIALASLMLPCQAKNDLSVEKFDWPTIKRFAVAYDWPTVERRDGREQPLVRAVQLLLRARGHDVVVDGIFGSQTARELGDFQRARGLKTRDRVNQPTWEALIVPLQKGARGDAVRALQTRLNRHGYDVAVDGVFGPQTQKKLGLFQSSRGNAFINGRADARTWCFLMGGHVAP